jgi:tRNA-dihydrouridine synthase A
MTPLDEANHELLQSSDRKKELHIAPMMAVSYTEFRYLMRLLSKHAVLWTEMIVDETLVHGDRPARHLEFSDEEHPIVCQLGGVRPRLRRD